MSTEVDAINRFLATNVMGWVQSPQVQFDGGVIIFNDKVVDFVHQWPDCERLLNQIEQDGWRWYWRCERKYQFTMYKVEDMGAVIEIADTRTAAMCRAVARAYNYQEDGNASTK